MFKFFNFFKKKESNESLRRKVDDVKPGECITIEWHKIQNSIGELMCLNNDPETKTILLEVTWNNKNNAKERLVLKYDSLELKNFHLLNYKRKIKVPVDTLTSLQKELQKAIDVEDYMKASKLQKQIDSFKK